MHFRIFIFLLLSPILLWSQFISPLKKVHASDRNAADNFSYSVAISGDLAIMGSPYDDEDTQGINTKTNAGSAYIFKRTPWGSWVQDQKLTPNDRDTNDLFGFAVSIAGNYAAVGAYLEDEDNLGTNFKSEAGSVYLFEKNSGGNWLQVQKIIAPDRTAGDNFAYAVAIHGNYLLVGAPAEDEDTANANYKDSAGSAYLYERDQQGQWNFVQKLIASDREIIDNFGSSLSISGNYIAIGARYESHDLSGNNRREFSGSTYVFERNGNGYWQEVQKIIASDRSSDDLFGFSVSISGNHLLVGAPYEDHDTAGTSYLSRAGSAYIFQRSPAGQWTEVQKITASDRGAEDRFGWSVSLSGNRALVGAFLEDHDSLGGTLRPDAGSAYFYEKVNGANWQELKKITAWDRAADDFFGFAVAIDGDYGLIGSPLDDEDSTGSNYIAITGSAYFFKYRYIIGIDENELANPVSVYPNPSEGEFTIKLKKPQEHINLRLMDISGKLLENRSFYNQDKLKLSFQLPAGTYLLNLYTEKDYWVFPIIRK